VRRLGLRFQPAWVWRHPDVREYLRLTLPLMVGLTMTFSTEFFFRFFGSYLPAGSIAVLNFSLRMMLILVGIFGRPWARLLTRSWLAWPRNSGWTS